LNGIEGRRQSFEFGIRNAECGKKKRRQMTEDRGQKADDRKQITDELRKKIEKKLPRIDTETHGYENYNKCWN
jgi:hypothetical protein